MTERWQEELNKLRDIRMPDSVWPRTEAGAHHDFPRLHDAGTRTRQRVIAAVVAFAVFAAAGTLVLRALRFGGNEIGQNTGRSTLSIRIISDATTVRGVAEPELNFAYGSLSLGFAPQTIVNESGNPPSMPGIHDPSGLAAIGPGFAASSRVELSNIPANSSVEMFRAAEFPAPSDWSLAQEGRLPGLGVYVLDVIAPVGSQWVRWELRMDVIRSGTVQFWHTPQDSSATGPEASFPYKMIVAGATRTAGWQGASAPSGPIDDHLPPVGEALDVRAGAVVRLVGLDVPSISYSPVGSPIGTGGGLIVMTKPYPTLDLSAGLYYLTLPVRSPNFTGDLVFVVNVTGGGAPTFTPSTVTASPVASDRLEVTCIHGTALISTQAVDAQFDGIHVKVTAAAGGERLGFVPASGGRPYISESAKFLSKGPIWAIGPGEYDVRCLPPGIFNVDKGSPGTQVEIFDPHHYWRSPVLDCPSSDQVRIEPAPAPAGATTEEQVIRAVVPGVVASDTVDIAGYPQRYEGLGHRVVRDGKILAIVYMGEATDVAGGKECSQILSP